MGFKSGAGDLGSDLKINDGTIKIKEQASAEDDTAAYGQLWVKSNSPNDLYFTNDAGNDVRITNGSSLAADGSSSSVAADDIDTGDGNIAIAGGSGHTITLNATAAQAQLKTTSSGEVDITSAANVDINATTTLTIDSGGAGSIDFAADASNITLTTDGAAEDFTISLAGATDSSLILSSTGTAADALQISTSAGGMDISVAGAAAGEDLDISCNQEIRVTSTSDAAEAIYLRANAGTSETIKIHADQGTAAASIGLTSDAGGITLSAGNTSHGVIVGDVSGAPVTIGHTTSETTVSDNLNVTGRLLVDDTTEATSTTDGSLQTDGGLSVAKDIVGGDDLILKSNAAAIQFGASSDILLTHHADAGSGNTQTITGLELSNSATSDNEYPSFILKSNEAVVAAGEFLGQILFRSTDTNVGTGDASWQAGISCKAQAAHTGTGANKTELRFKTSDDGIFEDRMLLDGDGHLELMKDDAELRFGAGKDVVFAHDNGTGMDVTSAGNFDLESTNGSITIGASLTDGQTLKLGKNGAVETIIAPHGTAGSEIYSVTNTAGTTDGTYGQGAMLFEATAGGIALKWADDKDLWAEGGRFVVTVNEDATDCIKLHADAGTSQTIQIVNDAGTTEGSDDAGAIELSAAAGGIGLAWADDKDLWAEGGQAMIVANHNAANAIKLHADAGADQTIVLLNDEGTGESAITLTSTAGGIDLNANAAKDITLNGGQVVLTGAHNTAGAIKLHADAGTSETIHLHSDQGTGEGASSSILLESDVGGIGIVATGLTGVMTDGNADAAITLLAAAGGIGLRTTSNLAGAIQIEADGGTSETIVIKADQGNGAASIGLVSDVGGITLDAGLDITLSADGGNVTMDDGTSTIFDFDVDGTTMTIHDDQDTGDKFSIAVAQHGATTITTVDDDAAAADLTFTIDGDTVFQAEGTEVARAVGTATSSTTNCANAFTFKTPSISFTSNGTLYPSDSGAIVLLSAQDVTVTLPDSATAANLGTRYTFIVNNADNGTKKIQCADATNEQILGRAVCYDLDTDSGDPVASTHVFTSAPGGNNDYVNFNGTTTGGIFSKMEIYAAGSDQWFVISSELFTTGTTATPFGNS